MADLTPTPLTGPGGEKLERTGEPKRAPRPGEWYIGNGDRIMKATCFMESPREILREIPASVPITPQEVDSAFSEMASDTSYRERALEIAEGAPTLQERQPKLEKFLTRSACVHGAAPESHEPCAAVLSLRGRAVRWQADNRAKFLSAEDVEVTNRAGRIIGELPYLDEPAMLAAFAASLILAPQIATPCCPKCGRAVVIQCSLLKGGKAGEDIQNPYGLKIQCPDHVFECYTLADFAQFFLAPTLSPPEPAPQPEARNSESLHIPKRG